MRTRSIVTVAVASAGMAAAATAVARAKRMARDFYEWRGSTDAWPTVDGVPARCPAYVNHLELFGSFHAADLAAVGRDLPSEDIHPVRLPNGRAIVFVGGLHYRDITNPGFSGAMAPPHGELMIALVVSRAAALPLVPLAGGFLPMPPSWRAGMFPVAIPVTHRWARDAGWAMGLPKFVADLDFEESVVSREVRAAEGDRTILRLRIPIDSQAQVQVLRTPMLTYASADGQLFEAESRTYAYGRLAMVGRGVELELGDHPVAAHLRDLGLAAKAFGTLSWETGRLILPNRHPVGDARLYQAYRGEDRWFGRYTIRYPGTAPVDQYAHLTREGIERAILRGGGRPTGSYVTIDGDLGHEPAVLEHHQAPTVHESEPVIHEAEPVAVG